MRSAILRYYWDACEQAISGVTLVTAAYFIGLDRYGIATVARPLDAFPQTAGKLSKKFGGGFGLTGGFVLNRHRPLKLATGSYRYWLCLFAQNTPRTGELCAALGAVVEAV